MWQKFTGKEKSSLPTYFLCNACLTVCHILKIDCFRKVYKDGRGGLAFMYSLIKVQLASEVVLSVATSLSSPFNPVFLKICGKHFKKCKSSRVCSKSSNP